MWHRKNRKIQKGDICRVDNVSNRKNLEFGLAELHENQLVRIVDDFDQRLLLGRMARMTRTVKVAPLVRTKIEASVWTCQEISIKRLTKL